MKKVLTILLGLVMIFSLCACSGGESEESLPEIPPAFSVIRKQLKLTKHTKKGESTAFTENDFSEFLGEEMSYITLTSLPENGTLVCNGTSVLKGQTIPAEELEYLKFIPNSDCLSASFGFTCDSVGYNGNELSCEMVFTDSANAPPVANDCSLETVEGISCEAMLDINEPNGDEYTINIVTYPADGSVTVGADGTVLYTPENGFSGSDKMIYTVTDCFGEVSAAATLNISVDKNENGLIFADMTDNSAHLYAHKMCGEDIMVYRCENGNYYFDPDAPVSKMDFLVMMMCVSELDTGITAVADSVVDDDSGLSSGLKGYLSAAAEKGLLRLDNGKFSPSENITLADAAYMTANALKLPSMDASLTSAGGNDAVYNAVNAAVKAGLLDTVNGAVDTASVMTKADAAELLCRIDDYLMENNIQKVS